MPDSRPKRPGKSKQHGSRRRARQCAVQGLYQIHMSGGSGAEVERQFREHQDMRDVDSEYFHELIVGVDREASALDESIAPKLDRQLGQLDPVEHSILRLGMFELLHHIEIPYRVVINEAVELAKVYGASESHRYVNSVLDKLAREHRSTELT